MKLEQQVCNQELSKRLKELGVKQESLYYHEWHKDSEKPNDSMITYTVGDMVKVHEAWEFASAFTVAELGEMLKDVKVKWKPHDKFQDENLVLKFWLTEIRLVSDKSEKIEHRAIANTEADARGKMLIYLLENNLIKP